MSKDGKGVSRRELLTFWRRPLKELSETVIPVPPEKRPPPLRPPGMMHELMLVNTCTKCGLCVQECPAHAIKPLGADWGKAAGTPYIDARKQPCVLCTGLRCTHVCPSGALIPVYVNRDVVMGTAVVDEQRCLTWTGQACDKCMKQCPAPGAIVAGDDGRIRIDADTCVGCGLCEHVCPTEPQSIRVAPRP
jgi:ferredoxin-type protein NapG